jgi:hypothetical protein
MTFSVSGFPKFTTAQFRRSVKAASATLSLDSTRRVARGTYPLTNSRIVGGLMRKATVTLGVQ